MILANIVEAKTDFLNAIDLGKRLEPVFTYRKLAFDFKEVLRKLREMEARLSSYNNPLVPYYIKLVCEDSDSITSLCNRKTPQFEKWLSKLYGFPTEEEVEKAYNLLARTSSGSKDSPEDSRKISPDGMKDEVEKSLSSLKIEGWEVVVENSSAMISVNPVSQRITLKQDATFQLAEKERLIVHEIGVHVTRSANGARQPYLIFVKGFPDYLMTEEGLALFAEKRTSLLSHQSLRKYCCRLITAAACKECGFWQCFERIKDFLPAADCFDIVARIKRGLVDTADMGGFTKDQIYLKGLWKIEELGQEEIRNLFFGKIGVEDLPVLQQLVLMHDVTYPKWVG